MTGHQPFSKLREAMSSERQAANATATQKAIAELPADRQATRLKTTPFDVADYLDDDVVAQEYLREASKDPDPRVREKAAADDARAAARRGGAPKPKERSPATPPNACPRSADYLRPGT